MCYQHQTTEANINNVEYLHFYSQVSLFFSLDSFCIEIECKQWSKFAIRDCLIKVRWIKAAADWTVRDRRWGKRQKKNGMNPKSKHPHRLTSRPTVRRIRQCFDKLQHALIIRWFKSRMYRHFVGFSTNLFDSVGWRPISIRLADSDILYIYIYIIHRWLI